MDGSGESNFDQTEMQGISFDSGRELTALQRQLEGIVQYFSTAEINVALQTHTEGIVAIPNSELIQLQKSLPNTIDRSAVNAIGLFAKHTVKNHSIYPPEQTPPFALQLPETVQINGKIQQFCLATAQEILAIINKYDANTPELGINPDVPDEIISHQPVGRKLIIGSDKNIWRTDCQGHGAHNYLFGEYFGAEERRDKGFSKQEYGYDIDAFLAELLRVITTGDYSKMYERAVMLREKNIDEDVIFWRGLRGRVILGLEAAQFTGAGTGASLKITGDDTILQSQNS